MHTLHSQYLNCTTVGLQGRTACAISQKDQAGFSIQQRACCLFQGAVLGRIPDGKAECNLVHEIGKVVHQIQSAVLDTAHQISEEVTKWVDTPTHSHDETHGAERSLHVLVHTTSRGTSLTCEDLEQDEKPAKHAD